MRRGNVHRPARRRPRRLALVAVALTLTSCAAPAPGPVPTDGPGTDGPCGVRRTNLANPADWRHDVALFEPTGTGAPWTGGVCNDDDRPVVLLAHGYGGSAPEVYQGLVDHFVSNGFLLVFPPYDAEFDPAFQYRTVEAGLGAAVAATRRADTTRFGVVGHSFGGGMAPHLVQVVTGHGWGSTSLWTVMFAPWFAFDVGTGAIDVPVRTRAAVVAYDEDRFVDARIGIDIFAALAVPDDQKVHVTVRSDRTVTPELLADHMGPLSFPLPLLGTLSPDHFDRWSAQRTVDSVAGCSLDGRWCDTELADMGTWPDGRAVQRGIVTNDPVDVGPPALQECEFFLNPRRC